MQIINKVWIIYIILLLFCSGIKAKKERIRLGVPPRSSFMPVFLAMEKGIFKKNGLDVELILDEKVSELYSEKKIDIICTGLTEPILFSSEGHATQIIYRFSYSLANDIIVAVPEIKNIETLKKKRISFDGINTSSHIFVQQLLNKKGIAEGDYYAKNLPVKEVLAELEKGNIDAGHTTGVSLSEITKRGWNIIGKSSDDPDLLSDTLSVDAQFLKDHPLEIQKIISSVVEAKDSYTTNSKESIAILAAKIGKSQTEIEEELKGVKFLSIKENIQSLRNTDSEVSNSIYPQGTSMGGETTQTMNFSPVGKKGGLFTAGETIIQFLIERGQLYRKPILKFIINDTFVKNQELK